MATARTVRVKLFRPPGVGTGTFFIVPFDVKEAYGKARAPIRVTIGKHTYRTTVAVYGGQPHVVVNGANQKAAGVEPGDTVRVRIEPDDAPRVVRAPVDLAAALAKEPRAKAAWQRMSYTHKREHAEAIAEAKRPETRERRVRNAVAAMIEWGEKA